MYTRHRSPEAKIHKLLIPEPNRRVPEPTPGPYDGHLKDFGAGLNNVSMGEKYKHKYSDVPPPGYYDPETSLIKSKS